jgi:AcrR family transcriptional regulator
MATATRTPHRKLSTAEERRETVLQAASQVFAERGYHGTPTMEVAREAGISQAYLFRLFPTKAELFGAVVERCLRRVRDAFADAAREAKASGEPVKPAIGAAYGQLLEDRELLLIELHSHAAAASDPAVREIVRRGFADLYELVAEETGATPQEMQRFFATGMLMNVLVALDVREAGDEWARVLSAPPETL